MQYTAFQKEWDSIAKNWGIRVEIPLVVVVAGHQITVPVLLRDFGARLGMLLVTDLNLIPEYANDLVELGYGYSCLSEPVGSAHPEEDEALIEMLADWGWSGNANPPA